MALLLVALAGCDSVFGLDGETVLPRCVRGDFAAPAVTVLPLVDAFSFTGNRERGIVSVGGIPTEIDGDGGDPQPIDIEPNYGMMTIALEPNGDFYFLTAAIEPPEIRAVVRAGGKWQFAPHVPKGTFAGTPTNRLTGPVRVLVKLSTTSDLFQEYERAADGAWLAVGDRFALPANAAANLTQDGLAAVFDASDGIYVAQRATIDDIFEAPQRVLEGVHAQPQLFDDCGTLYTIDDNNLTRYAR